MGKSILYKRCKGLLALMLAVVMLFGNSMSVFAASYDYGKTIDDKIKAGELDGVVYEKGDTIRYGRDTVTGGFRVTWYIDNQKVDPTDLGHDSEEYRYINYELTLPSKDDKYVITSTKELGYSAGLYGYEVYLEGVSAVAPSGQWEEHPHDFQWVTTIYPTVDSDGLSEYKCHCGAVNGSQPISAATASVKILVDLIREAQPGDTIVFEQDKIFCYTAKIMDELNLKQDVFLKTVYTDKDGAVKSFTIPSGKAPADGELFYGFTYLGNLYGWDE